MIGRRGSPARSAPLTSRRARLTALLALGVAAMALTACQTATTIPPPPPGQALPDLRGTWTGSWGGTPLTLAILEQVDAARGGGIYVGSWQIFGENRPGVSGLITFAGAEPGRSTTTHMRGWFGAGPTLVVEVRNPDGYQELQLRVAGERLTGIGTSNFPWGPRGPVELTRTAGRRP